MAGNKLITFTLDAERVNWLIGHVSAELETRVGELTTGWAEVHPENGRLAAQGVENLSHLLAQLYIGCALENFNPLREKEAA